ncbi:hypothetical protein L3V59_01725 [Burkholderia aenigmatica]|uniref:hypothetical protein n=1 Tax=Burkholderia TaxID=32008 RepID=UPI001CF1E7EC|nr:MULTISPECIES: hypothetical protein [Burkholderia]MCA8298492.1 hypothetical protein [Burkholderia sp. AU30198]UKD11818.1 hypothetical protein L3V59_01725 [Burkholderia aenigmatica]
MNRTLPRASAEIAVSLVTKPPDTFMIPTVTRCVVRLTFILIAAAAALALLLLFVVGMARYERDEGMCPNASIAELEAGILAFAKAQGSLTDEVEFVGTPRYHTDTLGWWRFDLRSGDASYVATIACDGRVTGFGRIQMLPLAPAKPAH